MPQYPNIGNDDVIVYGEMLGIQDAAPAVNGVCNIASPVAGRLKCFGLTMQSAPNANITLSIVTKHGTMTTTFIVPNATPISTLMFEVPQHDRSNYVDAGEPFFFQSDGNGAGGGIAEIFAVITKG